MRRVRMTVQYDGTAYHGWQEQRRPEGGAVGAGVRTVQGTLLEALATILGCRVRIEGAGRTDAGVHALGQVAAFDLEREMPLARLEAALNSRLPPDIAVADLAEAPPTFRPSADAVSKHYRYRLWADRAKPVLEARYVWHWWRPIALGPMEEAARHLVGRRDFASLQSRGGEREDTVRTLLRLEVAARGREIHFDVEGDAFLYRMVRNLVGTLVEVGCGHRPPEWVAAAVEARDRCAAGPCAPPQGLCLMAVRY